VLILHGRAPNVMINRSECGHISQSLSLRKHRLYSGAVKRQVTACGYRLSDRFQHIRIDFYCRVLIDEVQ
jgi:hypothetical protein